MESGVVLILSTLSCLWVIAGRNVGQSHVSDVTVVQLNVRDVTVFKCQQLATVDCVLNYTPDGDETVCGTDSVTYENLCVFAQAKCQTPNTTILEFGTCNHNETTASSPNQSSNSSLLTSFAPVNTSSPNSFSSVASQFLTTTPSTQSSTDVIHGIFCSHTQEVNCAGPLDPVCATNGQWYENECEFAKARCNNSHLHLQDLTICKNN